MSIIMSAYRGNITSSLPRLIVNIPLLWKGLKILHFWSRKALVNHLTDKISIALLTPSKNDDDFQSFMFNIVFLALESHASLSTVNIILAIKSHEYQANSFRWRWAKRIKFQAHSYRVHRSILLVMRDLSKDPQEKPFNNFWLHEVELAEFNCELMTTARTFFRLRFYEVRCSLGILIYITSTFLSFDIFFCILIFTSCAFQSYLMVHWFPMIILVERNCEKTFEASFNPIFCSRFTKQESWCKKKGKSYFDVSFQWIHIAHSVSPSI